MCHIVQAEIRRIEEERLEKLRQEEEARQEEARRAEEARLGLEPITPDVSVVAPEALANFSDAAQALIVEAMMFSAKCLKQLSSARY